MLKSVLNAALLVALVLCLFAATILFGGILTEYALPWYALLAFLLALLAVEAYRRSLALNRFQSEVMLRLAAACAWGYSTGGSA